MKHVLYFLGLFFTLTPVFAQQPGTFDGDFDGDGIGYYYFNNTNCIAECMTIQPDGKILVAGSTEPPSGFLTYEMVMRLNPDGSPDAAFGNSWGGNGIVVEQSLSATHTAEAIAVQTNGRIIVGGASSDNESFIIVHHSNSGLFEDWVDVTDLGNYAHLYALAIQPDDKIIAVGDSYDGISPKFTLVRYLSDGFEDNTFSFDGIVTADFGGSGSSSRAVAVQANGKIVAAGHANGKFALVRLNTDGTLDNSFGTGGKVVTPVGLESIINAIAIQSDGKIVVAGGSCSGFPTCEYTLARYNSNGTLDATFGTGGIVIVSDGMFNAVALQPDGKIVAVGSDQSSQTQRLIRFNTNGTRDNTFGVQGFAYPIYDAEGRAIGIQADGKIVVAGFSIGGTPYQKFCVARYLSGFNVGMVSPLKPATETLIYPNPVNTEASFGFELESATQASLSIYDLAGHLLQQPLTNTYLTPGKHEVLLSLSDINPGTYLLLLQAGKQTITTQFVKQ